MKKIFVLLLLILSPLYALANPKTVTIPKGAFIRVYPNDTISTSINKENDIVYFVNPTDLWVGNRNVIPVNSIFRGCIDFFKMPIQGVNGAFSIRITDLKLPNGTIKKIDGVIQYKGNTRIGGELAPPASYNYSVHPQKGWPFLINFPKGALQYVPSGKYEFGHHTSVNPSDVMFIILNSDLEI